MGTTVPILGCLTTGIILRLLLFRTSVNNWLETRAEVVSPLTSWDRAMEGLSLHKQGISPYSGDLFHETPLMLKLLDFISRLSPNMTNIFFVVLEIVQAMLLLRITRMYGHYVLQRQASEVKTYSADAIKLLLRKEDLVYVQFYVIVAFSFNPYSISACLAKSTGVFNNIAILLALYYMLKGNQLLCGLFIGLASYLSMYPIMLIVPAAIYFLQISRPRDEVYTDGYAILTYVITAVIAFVSLGVMILLSMVSEGSWSFLTSTYGFILTVPDLTPNMGIFWYFFTEMFEHFRTFFICVFQINAFIYTVPLAVRLKKHPLFLFYLLVFLIGIFKSYPSYGDVGLIFSLLPMWKHVFDYMRNAFVVTCMFICTTVFAPILHHLWLYAGSANANFYFAIALAFSTAEIFLCTDLMFGFLRRDFDLHNGLKHKLPNGKPAQVILD